MTKRNAINSDFTPNADGFSIGGGTTARTLTVSGGDIALSGGGGFTYTFPGATSTLYGTSSTPITSTNISATNLSSTNVYSTTVTATTLSGTNVKATTVTGTTLSGTTLSSTNVYATTVTGTTISATNFTGITRRIILPSSIFHTRPGVAGWAGFTHTQGTNIDYDTLDFDKDTDEKAISPPFVMENYNGGNVTIKIGWITSVTSGNVLWTFGFKGWADTEVWDADPADEGTIDDNAGDTAGDIQIASATVDIASSITADDVVVLKVYRDISGDNAAADARLLVVQIEYTEA